MDEHSIIAIGAPGDLTGHGCPLAWEQLPGAKAMMWSKQGSLGYVK